jgi:hypothetical protein
LGALIGGVAAAGVSLTGGLFGNKNAKKQATLMREKVN